MFIFIRLHSRYEPEFQSSDHISQPLTTTPLQNFPQQYSADTLYVVINQRNAENQSQTT